MSGVPVGLEIPDLLRCSASADASVDPNMPRCNATPAATSGTPRGSDDEEEGAGSIIVVVATDAPLLPHQLKRVATRVALGVGRMGGKGENSSGDIFLAFSTANPGAATAKDTSRVAMLPNDRINPLFYATVQATEEAIVNAMLGAETMTGVNDRRVYALPRDRLLAAMKKYGR